MFPALDRPDAVRDMAGCCAAQHVLWCRRVAAVKYWLIGLTAALSLMAMAPERGADGAAAPSVALTQR
jgi:hypothetical protein